ncbi:hypothetical protein SRHO_G00336800 [Serrasalmus rhombeus]
MHHNERGWVQFDFSDATAGRRGQFCHALDRLWQRTGLNLPERSGRSHDRARNAASNTQNATEDHMTPRRSYQRSQSPD